MRLSKLLHPVKDGTLAAAHRPLILRVKAPPPTPTVEEFVSPLRQEARALLDVKRGIGYAATCRTCQQHAVKDAELAQLVDAKQDATPYVVAMRGEIIKLRESNERLQKDLADAKQWNLPLNRIRIGIYAGMGAGVITLAITLAKILLGF